MPAASAASFRLMPESALAIASSRRATRVLASALASLRRTAGTRSPLMVSAAMMPSLQITWIGNHDPVAGGIAAEQQESFFRYGGIRWARQQLRRSYPHGCQALSLTHPPEDGTRNALRTRRRQG